MSFFRAPQILAGPRFNLPGINPTVRLPSVPVFNLPGGAITNTIMSPTAAPTGTNSAPLGDWKTAAGLSPTWGTDAPMVSQFINPDPTSLAYLKSMDQMRETIKNQQPIIDVNAKPIAPPAYVAPKPFDVNAYLTQMNQQMRQQYGPKPLTPTPTKAVAPTVAKK